MAPLYRLNCTLAVAASTATVSPSPSIATERCVSATSVGKSIVTSGFVPKSPLTVTPSEAEPDGVGVQSTEFSAVVESAGAHAASDATTPMVNRNGIALRTRTLRSKNTEHSSSRTLAVCSVWNRRRLYGAAGATTIRGWCSTGKFTDAAMKHLLLASA